MDTFQCRLCEERLHLKFQRDGMTIYRCRRCGLEAQLPQPDDDVLRSIYSADYFLFSDTADEDAGIRRMKEQTAEGYVRALQAYAERRPGTLLEIGPGRGDFLAAAAAAGIDVSGIEISPQAAAAANARLHKPVVQVGTLDTVQVAAHSIDVCAAFDTIEHARDPVAFLQRIHSMLNEHGILFLVTPSLDSLSARCLGRRWMEYKREHLFYFNRNSIHALLRKTGFENIVIRSNYKVLNFDYIHRHFRKFPVPVVNSVFAGLHALLPATLQQKSFSIVASGMNVLCRKQTVQGS